MKTIALIGYMATGKSAVSRYLGEALNLPVIDLDQYIEHKQGMTISEIFAQQGEGDRKSVV